MRRISVILAVACVLGVGAATVEADKESWEFTGVDEIRLDGVSGDLIIRPATGNKIVLELRSDVHPSENFRGEVDQSGSTVRIDEDWSGSNSSGDVEWTLFLPNGANGVSVEMSTASGDIDCAEVALQLDFESASGDVKLDDVELADRSEFSTASGDIMLSDMTVERHTKFSTASGDVELSDLKIEDECSFSTASGDVSVEGCTAGDDVDFSSASGDVEVRRVQLEGESRFSSASGDVSVVLDKLPKHDLVASSASGDVDFKAGAYGDDFKLVLVKRKDKGRISCPFKYTKEDEYEDHHVYEVKIVERGKGAPEIKLKTASGKVTVKD
ncbi:MAG: DUF4097 family beta strand repeat protein [Candidatus Latescibacterota bacterium]|nr:MAG: DUF4097 family beta strand repeat protein [Candidatus Latescibacterota bacterium]